MVIKDEQTHKYYDKVAGKEGETSRALKTLQKLVWNCSKGYEWEIMYPILYIIFG